MSIARKSDRALGDAVRRRALPSFRASLTVKVLTAIVIVSMLSTAVFSALEVRRESRSLIAIEKNESRAAVEATLNSLALAVWTIDQRAIEVTARSLLRKSIYRAEIVDDFGDRWTFVKPNPPDQADDQWSRSLLRPDGQEVIGSVRVWENYDDVRALLKQRMLSLIVAEVIKVALLGALLFVIVRGTVTQPLWRLASGVQSGSDREEPITLDRPFRAYRDEIDAVVDAINDSDRERQRLEAERDRRRQYEERASKLEALGRLAGGVAHDFNNVLTVMSGYIDFLREDLPQNSKVRDYAERLARCNETAQKLVRQIVAFSRNEAITLRPVSLPDILNDVRSILRSAIPATTDLSYEVPARLPPVCADPNQIAQVLLNLAMNAHDALDGRPGRVVIRAGAGEVGRPIDANNGNSITALEFDTTKPHVRLEVQDSGSGMPTEVMKKIFEPFYTTKDVGKGTGLGLSIVYNIVKLHNGGLRVTSVPDQGTTFSIFLTMANETADAGAPAPAPTVDAAKRRILVVDDQDTVREMLQIGLARNGYDVGCRSSPQAALAAVEADPGAFDLVITDQWMPDMAGIDLVRRMKRINPALRCVLATGFSDTVDAGTARAAGADAFVQKPIRVGDLVAIIEGLFDKNRA